MEAIKRNEISVSVNINSSLKNVWQSFTVPDHIKNWNFASEDWCCPSAVNELREGGSFSYRMEAKDGSFGFDFSGKYIKIETNKIIEYFLDDDRKVQIIFIDNGNNVEVIEVFEAENMNSAELQKLGWQNILDNFKKYVESLIE